MKRNCLLIVLILLIAALPAYAQPESTWHAWAYLENVNRLVLMDANGEILDIPAPMPLEESLFTHRFFAVSRDGTRLVMVSSTDDERPLVLLRDLNTGAESVWFGEPSEWTLPTSGDPHAIPTVTFSPDHSLYALGLGNPDAETWRVVVFNTSDGAVLFQLTESHPDMQAFVLAQPLAVSYVMPVVRLFEETRIHIQLVTADTEGVAQYPALIWLPGDNRIEASPYDRALMDIDPATGEIVFPYEDSSAPVPESFGFIAPYNALRMGEGQTWVSGADIDLILSSRWAGDRRAVVFQSQNPDTFETRWNFLRLDGDGTAVPLPPDIADVRGVREGFISIQANTGNVAFHPLENPTAPAPVMTIVPGDDVIQFIWVQPPGIQYAGPRR